MMREEMLRMKKSRTHSKADALDWDEAMELIANLKSDGFYRDAMLIACGCFLGLRISDILLLRWEDVMTGGVLVMREKKTRKMRKMKINEELKKLALECYEGLGSPGEFEYIFQTVKSMGEPMTRQRAGQILREAQKRYNIKSAEVFSTHSLRKTFGRRVWLQECEKGKGDQALLLLCDIFGHSSISITKRYLGIRQDELLSVYDALV